VVPEQVSMHTGPMLIPAWTKNIVSMSTPLAGVYCLKPDASIDAGSTPAVVSPEYAYSSGGKAMLAYTSVARNACPKDTIEVRTFTVLGSTYVLSDRVAFTIVIP
jgi:hypothetical protein